jgi:hypothetical protein
MPKAEMRTAKRTARKDPSIFFFLSFYYRKRNLDFTLKRCFRVSEKGRKLGKKREFIRGGRLFSRQRAIYTHINGDHTSE